MSSRRSTLDILVGEGRCDSKTAQSGDVMKCEDVVRKLISAGRVGERGFSEKNQNDDSFILI